MPNLSQKCVGLARNEKSGTFQKQNISLHHVYPSSDLFHIFNYYRDISDIPARVKIRTNPSGTRMTTVGDRTVETNARLAQKLAKFNRFKTF